MIKIRFYAKPDRGTLHMTIRGHAGAGKKGEDLVCAGATMLAYTLAQAVEFLFLDGKLRRKPKLKISEGDCEIICCPNEDSYGQALMAYWVQQCGAQTLAKNFPENVHLDLIRVTDKASLA